MSYITPDRSPPYTVRHMTNATGHSLWHVLGRDGFSIIATCNNEREAALLAAAPRLLDACEALMRWDGAVPDRGVFDAARAAIAKATGGAK